MTDTVPLVDAFDTAAFGSKAVGLGAALRDGLPVPPGVALSGSIVEAVASGDEGAVEEARAAARGLKAPLAVRSSAVDEDGADASFAGQHLTLLNVPSLDDVAAAVREVWWSANSDSAITYRQRVGLFTRPSIGVVVQKLLDPETAGVMFTKNPITGADERMIEASWGLGESVVAGMVIPDNFRVDRSGRVLQRTPGLKKIAIRSLPSGGTVQEAVSPGLAEKLCLDDQQIEMLNRLARRAEEVYGPARDIEWAFSGGELYLLQCRSITTLSSGPGAGPAVPVESLERVALFAGLDGEETEQLTRLFKKRRFAKGEIVVREGSGGAAFYLIESGEAAVSVDGVRRTILKEGDHFGEIALIDEGPRTATITALTDLSCYGLTFWDFRPVVQASGPLGWKLLQAVVAMLRAEQSDRPN